MRDHVKALKTRQHAVRNAIVLCVVTVALTMLTTILIILPALVPVDAPGQLTVTVFALGLTSFAAGLFFALEDTFLSIRMVEEEVTR